MATSNVIPFSRSFVYQWFRRAFGGGTMFNGNRDMYTTFGYNRTPRCDDFIFKYLKQDIAKRIIDAPVKATWSDPPIIESTDEQFTKAWQNLTAAHRIWHQLMRLDRLCGLGQYAIMVIGLDDGADLATPIQTARGRSGGSSGGGDVLRRVLYMQSYLERSVKIVDYESDARSPRFGLPTMYEVTPTGDGDMRDVRAAGEGVSTRFWDRKVSPFKVHWTRVLHIADNTLENPIFGSSRLECVYNLLDDLLKVVGGSAETYWLTANRGLQVDVDKEMDLGDDDAKNLEEEIDEYEHNLRRVIRTRGVKINNLGSDLADPWNNVDVIIGLIASATGIPKRVLMGSEAGQLASTQDRANWAERMAERQADFAGPVVLMQFILQLIGMGVLPAPKDLSLTWPEAFKLSPLERAQTSAQMARSAANLQKMISDPIGGIKVEETSTEQEVEDVTDPLTGEVTSQPKGAAKQLKRTWIEGGTPLFSAEEARKIVGFGKTMPVFDDKQDSSRQITSR